SLPIVLSNTSYNNGGIPYVLSDLKARNYSLSLQDHVKLLLALAKEYGVNIEQVTMERFILQIMRLYLSYHIEWNMRHALKPTYETFFQIHATLKLHQITWNDHASLLEKTFVYEILYRSSFQTHPITMVGSLILSLQDHVKLLLALAKEYGVNIEQVTMERFILQIMGLYLSYRIEWNMRHALKPTHKSSATDQATGSGGVHIMNQRS
ncbi:hypothetical protein HID58_091039, partial [Brassica napus]